MSEMTRGSVTVERVEGQLCAVITLADGDPIVSAERIQKGQEN